jgi:FSR family fosmidomycin resistance protein-like MFS transporter
MSGGLDSVTCGAAGGAGVRARLGIILCAHTMVDIYAALVPPLLGVLEIRCHLEPRQTALLLGIGSLSSGLSQPLSAILGDWLDSRVCGAAGLLLAGVCLSSIGMVESFAGLVAIYVLGMVGVGIFHPVGASSMGHLADRLPRARRSLGVSLFFVAGMAGGITGAALGPRLTALPAGWQALRGLVVPGLLLALLLHLAIGGQPHRHRHQAQDRDLWPARRAAAWRMVGLLYAGNAMRFTVNMALVYLFVRWAQGLTAAAHPLWSPRDVARTSAPVVGNLNALVILGMAVGGLAAGALTRAGREKGPLVLVPILFAPMVALFPLAGLRLGYGLALLAGIGFASMIPVTLSLAQRLLPHRTSLASGLMLGGAWTVAMSGPILAERSLDRFGLGPTFAFVAALLALSGLVALPLPRRTAD